MKRIIVILGLLCCPISLSAQDKQNISIQPIDIYTIVNNDLHPILDSIVLHEKGKEYYAPNVRFEISNTSDGLMQINVLGMSLYSNSIKGVINYSGHEFLIYGVVDNELFKQAGSQKTMEFWKELHYKDEKTGKVVFCIGLDDGMTIWKYHYRNGGFTSIDFFEAK